MTIRAANGSALALAVAVIVAACGGSSTPTRDPRPTGGQPSGAVPIVRRERRTRGDAADERGWGHPPDRIA